MFCQSCGRERRPNSNFCPHCGAKQKIKQKLNPFTIIFLSLLLVGSIALSVFVVTTFYSNVPENLASENVTSQVPEPEQEPEVVETTAPTTEKQELQDEQKRELTDIIATAQETVYTVFTQYSQGSGFLYNDNGAVVTNAHVVEGETKVFIKTINGTEYPGTVIGYSNETDVAVIHVPDLVGIEPFELEISDSSKIGEEIIALGSPLGLENTATMGYITGKNRSFVIDPYVYENLYQISAPISPGSSGGPLINKVSEKIVAINSAESIEEASIGFSIPLYTVHSLIESWINQPMNEEDILAQFYGDTYNEESWSEGYFDGGEYSEDEDYYNYWEYDYEDFWAEFGDALWEYFEDENSNYDNWYDEGNEYHEEYWSEEESIDSFTDEGYVDPNTDPNMHYDEETGEWSYYDEVEDQWYYYDEYLQAWTYFDEYDGLWYYYDEELEEYFPF
ncbi:trypsin-like peptidase domain-containing protein [Paucisalibacillus globulus]|uniref:trypsin-like peptidase domain-containing protein n=1 Tax=Paucisalibacillus globulus TaxID=351095 RepID=UPI000BB6807E|nr:trypsin-like peptidase domain-containing protein [Paucisalibacillus globulus]